jgi:hypothetical protein
MAAPFRICAIAVPNDSFATGARKAFEAEKLMLAGRKWSEVPLHGVDGFPRTGQAFVNRHSLIATAIVPPLAGPALETAAKAITTKTEARDLNLIPGCSYPAIESLGPNRSGGAAIGASGSHPWRNVGVYFRRNDSSSGRLCDEPPTRNV